MSKNNKVNTPPRNDERSCAVEIEESPYSPGKKKAIVASGLVTIIGKYSDRNFGGSKKNRRDGGNGTWNPRQRKEAEDIIGTCSKRCPYKRECIGQTATQQAMQALRETYSNESKK